MATKGSKTTDDSNTAPHRDPLSAVEIDSDDSNDDDDEEEGRLAGLPEAVRERLEAIVPELVKKTFAAGMGAVLGTEEGIRRVTREMKLPKDVAGYLLDTAGNTKDEFMRILAREVREFLQTVNLSEEIAKMLTLLSFEVKTEIRFIPNDEKYAGVEPDVKASVRLKRNEPKNEPEASDPDEETRPRRRLRRRTER